MKLFSQKKILAAAAALLIGIVCAMSGERGLPVSEGILNFGRVDDTLCRGAQPDENGIKNLKALGVKTIISLRQPKEISKTEASEAAANGIVYTNISLGGFARPKDADVRKVLNLIEGSPGPVFVHCEHGCDRTGTIVACYRIEHDHWTAAEALNEAEKYGISKLERGMRRYVEDFAKADARKAAKATP